MTRVTVVAFKALVVAHVAAIACEEQLSRFVHWPSDQKLPCRDIVTEVRQALLLIYSRLPTVSAKCWLKGGPSSVLMVERAKLRRGSQKDWPRTRRSSWSVAAATCYAGYAGCHCFVAEMARATPQSPQMRGIADEGLRRREPGLDRDEETEAAVGTSGSGAGPTGAGSGYRSCLRALSFLGVHRACGLLTARRRQEEAATAQRATELGEAPALGSAGFG